MRQGQQNRRGRGRNRKGQNPLARNFESNGPDVKIRGTAAHIAEKYMALARDAVASGDQVLAENYLQHAEHYNRIIMAAQPQMQPHDPMNGQRMRQGEGGQPGFGDAGVFDGEDEGDDQPSDAGFGQEAPRFMETPRFPDQQGEGRQPYEPREPREPRFGGGGEPPRPFGEGRSPGEHRGRRRGRGRHHDNGRHHQAQAPSEAGGGPSRDVNGMTGGGQHVTPHRHGGDDGSEGPID